MTQACLTWTADVAQTTIDRPVVGVGGSLPGKRSRPKEASLTTDNDETLLERIAADDQVAFRLLIERHIDRAFGLALRILNNRTDADDVVQDTLLKVWMNRRQWEPGRAKFSTWLYRVVANRCIDLLRKPRSEDIAAIPEPADQTPSAIASLQQSEVTSLLERAMNRLPEQQRVALILSYHENLNNTDIADVMQTTVAAVESLLKRGRQRLRELLRHSEKDIRGAFTND
jgi:RNA polymerase sigma-70 factor (ECF subfamily)